MSSFTARIYGYPTPWARPRFQRRGAFVQVFEKKEVTDWKRTVQAQAILVKPEKPLSGPLLMRLTFHLPRPTSLPKKIAHHVKKPDIDNLFKAIADALNGIAYVDDSQIVALFVRKIYSENPGAEIEVDEIGHEAPRAVTLSAQVSFLEGRPDV